MLPRGKNKRIVFVSGGSFGHFLPSLEYARIFRDRGCKVFFLTNRREFLKIIKDDNFEGSIINIGFFRYQPAGVLLRSLAYLLFSSVQSLLYLVRIRPKFVFLFGGYPCLMPGLICLILRIPFLLHEQNVLYGKANKFLAPWAKGVGVQEWTKSLHPRKEFICPLPLRKEFREYSATPQEARFSLGLAPYKKTLLFMGGSQGSRFINNLFLEAQEYFKGRDFQFIIICGRKEFPYFERFSQKEGVKVFGFYESIWRVWRASSLAVMRAGILSLYEGLFSGVGIVAIPYPYAGRHQVVNALYFQRRGLVKVFLEKHSHQSILKYIEQRLDNEYFQVPRSSCKIVFRDPQKFLLDGVGKCLKQQF